MTTSVPGSRHTAAVRSFDRRRLRRQVLRSVVRIVVVTGTLVGVYASAPIDQRPGASVAVRLTFGFVALVLVLGWQIWSVRRSPNPVLRGVESVVFSLLVLVLTFAVAYYAAGRAESTSFSETLSKLDAVYFAMTVLTTVGFGDIAPRTVTARALVTSQMVVDLAFGGVVLKVLVGAVRRRRDEMDYLASIVEPDANDPT